MDRPAVAGRSHSCAPLHKGKKALARDPFEVLVRAATAIMLKDKKKYASTGGWGFQAWAGGDPTKPLVTDPTKQCFGCHQPKKTLDAVPCVRPRTNRANMRRNFPRAPRSKKIGNLLDGRGGADGPDFAVGSSLAGKNRHTSGRFWNLARPALASAYPPRLSGSGIARALIPSVVRECLLCKKTASRCLIASS
jgi:Cytochrome P460